MSKHQFHFREFSMEQSPFGQRVNTDSCAFGALIGLDEQPKRVLDIGCGTGVLTLMMAQRFTSAFIVGLEPELDIAAIAERNAAQSSWHERIEIRRGRIQDMFLDDHERFDFVICNPPYFLNSMNSQDASTAAARHNTSLDPHELYQSMARLVTDDGTCWISFPADNERFWQAEGIRVGLKLIFRAIVADHPNTKPHMTVVGWSKKAPETNIPERKIYYRDSHQGQQSEWMRSFRDGWYPAKYNDN
jgi:tRNA1Val (adenine37-N6)-methyltransferase